MFKKKVFLFIMLLCLVSFIACKDNNVKPEPINFSNIPNLHEQPLEVIQKAVKGKWQGVSAWNGWFDLPISNTVFEISIAVDITDQQYFTVSGPEDEIKPFIDQFIGTYSPSPESNEFVYSWAKINYQSPVIFKWVMFSFVGHALYPWSIKNDTLLIKTGAIHDSFRLSRIKDGDK